jgi:ribokinase
MEQVVKWDMLVLGGANMDYATRGPELPGAGRSVQGDLFIETPGGKGANQAIAAARLGAKVALVACIGRDNRGEAILQALNMEGVNTDFVVRHPSEPTGVVLIHIDAQGEKQTMAVKGANSHLRIEDLPEQALQGSGAVLAQLEIPLDTVIAAARLAKAAGASFILDPAPPLPLPDELLGLADLVKPNSFEAEFLTGIKVVDRDSAREAAMQLMERGAKAVSVQAGSQGNLLVWEGGESWNAHIPVNSVDTTGAGDAMAAALALALVEDWRYEKAGRIANTAAALATTKMGAQAALPSRAEVLQFVKPEGGPSSAEYG